MVSVLSFGAGVQSTAMLLMAVHGELDLPEYVIFADTHQEPQYVYDHHDKMKTIAEEHGVTWIVVSAGDLGEIDLAAMAGEAKGVHVPYFTQLDGNKGMLARTCTRHFKIDPIRKAIRSQILGLTRGQRSITEVNMMIGISFEERTRMTTPKEKWLKHQYPLVERHITRLMCEDWLKEAGYEIPRKSACVFCPYRSREQWREMKLQEPAEFRKAVEFDTAIRSNAAKGFELFLLPTCEPLAEADLRNDQDRGQLLISWNDECEGMCGM